MPQVVQFELVIPGHLPQQIDGIARKGVVFMAGKKPRTHGIRWDAGVHALLTRFSQPVALLVIQQLTDGQAPLREARFQGMSDFSVRNRVAAGISIWADVLVGSDVDAPIARHINVSAPQAQNFPPAHPQPERQDNQQAHTGLPCPMFCTLAHNSVRQFSKDPFVRVEVDHLTVHTVCARLDCGIRGQLATISDIRDQRRDGSAQLGRHFIPSLHQRIRQILQCGRTSGRTDTVPQIPAQPNCRIRPCGVDAWGPTIRRLV